MKNLVDLIGPGAAKDLFFTGGRIDAAETKALGLVSRSLIRGCFESADYTEGRTAFMQKRKPAFTGR